VLPALLTGRHLWTVLLTEPGSDDPQSTACTAEFDWKYISVNGTKTCTHDGASHAMALTRSAEQTGRNGLTWLLLDLAGPGVTIESGLVHFAGVRVTHDHVLGTRDDGWPVVKTIMPYLERSLAGRIRRGLVHVEPGAVAGNLERTVAEVLASHQPPPPPPVDRRTR
ncbi:MAG: hypothetical protein WCC60_08140, partial [Ilumatobacteraceae bacterium]